MPENKTKPTKASVIEFLNKIQNERKRKDCFELLKMMQAASKEKPALWGTSIIGFGNIHYVYDSGHEGDTAVIGFAPRKQNITIYLLCGFSKVQDDLAKMGKYQCAKVCLYIKSLDDVDRKVLSKILTKGFKLGLKYPSLRT